MRIRQLWSCHTHLCCGLTAGPPVLSCPVQPLQCWRLLEHLLQPEALLRIAYHNPSFGPLHQAS